VRPFGVPDDFPTLPLPLGPGTYTAEWFESAMDPETNEPRHKERVATDTFTAPALEPIDGFADAHLVHHKSPECARDRYRVNEVLHATIPERRTTCRSCGAYYVRDLVGEDT
jgi:hypothetical protein